MQIGNFLKMAEDFFACSPCREPGYPPYLAMCIALMVFLAILASWAVHVTTARHSRLIVVGLIAITLVHVAASDLCFLLIVTVATCAILHAASSYFSCRWRRNRLKDGKEVSSGSSRHRTLTLADLLRITLIASCMTAAVTAIPRSAWHFLWSGLPLGIMLGVAATSAWSITQVRHYLQWTATQVGCGATLFVFIVARSSNGVQDSYAIVAGSWTLVAAWCMAIRVRGGAGRRGEPRAHTRLLVRVLADGLFAVLLVVPAVCLLIVIFMAIRAESTLPDRGAYWGIIEAGRRARDVVDVRSSPEQDREVLRREGRALEEARWAIRTTSPSPHRTGSHLAPGSLMSDYRGIKALSKLFALSGRVAEADGRHSDALRDYLDMLSIVSGVSHGGLLFHVHSASGMQYSAILRLHSIRTHLDRNDCRMALTTLQDAFLERTGPEELLARTRDWETAPFCWRGRASRVVTDRLVPDETILALLMLRDVQYSLLIAEIALEAYRLDHRDYPANLEQLVPEYLTRKFGAVARRRLNYIVDGDEALVFYRTQPGDGIDPAETVDVNWPRLDHGASETVILSNVILLDEQGHTPLSSGLGERSDSGSELDT
ncbi:MAG: hypothetical protein GY854_31380 [Deltaproteobacteria bacterium]|nr:hypothetical protein [Deltaproteobacteria bacterium]